MTPHPALMVQPSVSKMGAETDFRCSKARQKNREERKSNLLPHHPQIYEWCSKREEKESGSYAHSAVWWEHFPPSNHLCAMADHHGHPGRVREGRKSPAPLVLSLLTGAFAAWCQWPVVITRLSLSYRYTNVPPTLECQLSSVIRHRAATAQ